MNVRYCDACGKEDKLPDHTITFNHEARKYDLCRVCMDRLRQILNHQGWTPVQRQAP